MELFLNIIIKIQIYFNLVAIDKVMDIISDLLW